MSVTTLTGSPFVHGHKVRCRRLFYKLLDFDSDFVFIILSLIVMMFL